MDYLELILTFHQKYGKRWYDVQNVLFVRYLLASLVIVLFCIIYLANHNFNQEDIYQAISDRYKDYIVNVYNTFGDENLNETEYYESYSDLSNIEGVEDAIESISKDRKSTTENTEYSDLLFDDFETLSYEVENIAPPTRFFKRTNKSITHDIIGIDGKLNPQNYKIYRNAGLYLDIPKYLLEEKVRYVHRDQEDILKVIYSKSAIIEFCYQKAARRNLVNSGFVKVEFQIASNGYVLPASIRIMDSTIRNKNVEQCIKKNIRRWRNFEKLEDSHGIAHVVHKFVFN